MNWIDYLWLIELNKLWLIQTEVIRSCLSLVSQKNTIDGAWQSSKVFEKNQLSRNFYKISQCLSEPFNSRKET